MSIENYIERMAGEVVSLCDVDPDDISEFTFRLIEKTLTQVYEKGRKDLEDVMLESNQRAQNLLQELFRLKIKVLRAETGVGLMDAKKALIESREDLDVARWYLENVGLAIVQRPSFREQLDAKLGLL